MSLLRFDLATPADDEGLRRLLRENPMQGSISLSFEREPCYFNASPLEGPFQQTLVAHEVATGEVVGFSNRSVRPMFLNGSVQSVGYMSQLRIHPKLGQGLYLARALGQGFEYYHALHSDGRAPFYLMSIIEDNLPARRLLTSGLPHYPSVQEYQRLFTCAIYPVRRQPNLALPGTLRLARGTAIHAEGIVACLNRNSARRQFSPFWTVESLFIAHLSPADFFLALDGDRVVGCLACWDQSLFKQTVLRGYTGPLKRWRKLLNLLAPVGGWPILPEPNTHLRYAYASHLAVDADDPRIFAGLLRALYNHSIEQGYSYFMLGLAEAHPLHNVVAHYRPIIYKSQLYLVAWEDGQAAVDAVDKSLLPAPEIALL